MSKIKYIYILSQRYSGSTLLSFLLATHPDISTIGERRKFYNKSIRPDQLEVQHCSCGKLFRDCEYWSAIKTRFLDQADPQLLHTNITEFQYFKNKYLNKLALEVQKLAWWYQLRIPFLAPRTDQLTSANATLVETILEQDHNQVFLDSSKIIDHALFLSTIDKFDFRIIWLVRDPRAQVHSALKYNPWEVSEAARRWTTEMNNNRRWLDRQSLQYTMLRYEALCRSPEDEMLRLLEFLELDPGKFSLDFRSHSQHIMGNTAMRMGKDTKIIERKEWQQDFTQPQIQQIEKLTRKFHHYYSS